ncbi:succinate dehydrogenase cytochrome b subunit [Solirubrobacter sp. CPCC 204708]|uniref:Succinate dehydrogenase cytochrome b subunit n=1 Tax=Solirubrobacter deserti TaxID=2282478 RepID=A0ABT4RGA2_9ACTN|nr:succinate dehydrogenase cytochrome b subunit [Solirubrobacter deserti]MBE2319685.1 succinate dehydrogenase cytochrome b subunit [Solirubrobacter deserti]MDA0137576.1 succinate dehydrogenase cytochrome b subunit [Solirubrobacter deserti]
MSAAVSKRPSLYATAVGKKYAMAVSGLILMGYVLLHMIGNLKVYFGAESLNAYAEWLREIGEPALPREWLLWGMRFVLLAAVFIHIHAAYALTMMNRRARPVKYESKRDFVAADFASRTMRWTGIIVVLFVIWHLLDLTWGTTNPDFVKGDVYRNLIASFERAPVAIFYVLANMALGVHLYHGAWSLFQSMGWYGTWRRSFAIGFAAIVVMGNVSFPLAVMFGVIN